MKNINKEMKNFLAKNGLNCSVKFINKGSLCGTWRVTKKGKEYIDGSNLEIVKKETIEKLSSLGFKDFDGKDLSIFSGNGGRFCFFLRK